MKLKRKIFNSLTGEPAMTQGMANNNLEIYWLNDTPHYEKLMKESKYSLWTSDGKNYKLLIEKEYYETMGDIYSHSSNQLWINYLNGVGKMQFKVNLLTAIIYVAVLGVVITLGLLLNEQLIILFGLIGIVILGTVFNNVFRVKVRKQSDALQRSLIDNVGEEHFYNAIKRQTEYYEKMVAKYSGDGKVRSIENSEGEESPSIEPEVIEEVEIIDEEPSGDE